MNADSQPNGAAAATVQRPTGELELADGTCLVPDRERTSSPSRIDGSREGAFSLADALRGGGEPFAGYRLLERD